MKTTKLALSFAFFTVFGIGKLQAQSYETISKWDKSNAPAVAIDVNAPDEIAAQSLFDMLKSEKLKGKKSGKNVSFEKIVFPTVSNDYINLYASVVSKDNNNSTVAVFVNKGIKSDFVSSTTDPKLIENLKAYLNDKYAQVAAKANLDYKIANQQKLISDSSKDLIKMQNDLEKKVKQKEKLISDIDDLSKQIEQQKTLLEQQKVDLDKIAK
jgi:predicted ester cyclase